MQLPTGSRYQAQLLGGPQHREWTTETYLLALVADLLNNLIHITTAVNSKRRPKAPQPIERPGKKKQPGGGFAGMARAAFLAAQKPAAPAEPATTTNDDVLTVRV